MRNDHPIVSALVATDLVDLARVDSATYRRRQESARSVVRITGAPEVLADLRARLDEALAATDPARAAVALASTIGEITR
ncbi:MULTISPECIES: hypothetical protein [unclassified Gordonia (in: high G+C Gram-positive bacteria)]|uniref:hypothetical protein n=1 Tax=unclassified Gordonia (in: high G+C Gram-positive bacteria) TaxID=2657482 RepID=UPI000839E448|nr:MULTISPECIES: hypothetical protein [unclassified Gordonia (in: high G+C Gram-positive bacteria)]MBN0975495.1 hypothetical protein [Gordonia sp. BP-119]MBN0984034.1 hypothetical protein [Gordonia sp. BP-94]OCW85632.1 hypothetical protein A8M60_04845 [Nocardia farcinica]WGJ84194.1 hypothetical protein QAD21_15515 [Gordonia sp. SMJS1]